MKLLSSRSTRSAYSHIPFFAGWTNSELDRVRRLVETVEYPAGQRISSAGVKAREFVIIADGDVALVQDGRPLRTLRADDTIGEEGLLSDVPAIADAIAITTVKALVLGPRQFDALLHEAPSMGRRLSQRLANRRAELPASA